MIDETLKIENHPDWQDIQYVEQALNSFNIRKTGLEYDGDLATFVRDEAGIIKAGLIGGTWGDGTEIKYLWVDEDWRGQGYGSQLLQMAEQEARQRGSRQLFLDTHTFQAPDFYPKFGFEVFGVLENWPVEGYNRYFFKKTLK